MKKSISVLLALVMVLSMAACMKVRAAEKPVAAAEANVAKDAVTATAAPTEAPTPEPTEVPFDVAIAEANEKLQQVKSMHMDMEMNMGMVITIAMGELKQTMPMDILVDRLDIGKRFCWRSSILGIDIQSIYDNITYIKFPRRRS